MDDYLVRYLKSGRAWLLVGSGPSIEMGYPQWNTLATEAIQAVRLEHGEKSITHLERANRANDYPKVFDLAKDALGWPKLLEVLRGKMNPSHPGKVFDLLSRWPIPVYMTTNYDDEIHKHLTSLGVSYLSYSNSEDHFGLLHPELQGAIFKLHGDLRSEAGLILTSGHYSAILEHVNWQYWRTKLTSIFQLHPVVVIGHSLTDPNIRHVLEAAKQGAGVTQPVCWIAPDVGIDDKRKYLEQYRIRVISYSNQDGSHRNLLRLVETISQFIPQRVAVRIQNQIDTVSQSPLGANAGAAGFFVFNSLLAEHDWEERRLEVLLASIEAVAPELAKRSSFTITEALGIGGWPQETAVDDALSEKVADVGIARELLAQVGPAFTIAQGALRAASEKRVAFQHLRDRFRQSLRLRLKRGFPGLSDAHVEEVSSDIDASLTGYFRVGGLSLASTLLTNRQPTSTVPSSILKFISDSSARYDDLLRRQAFITASVDAFVNAESAERQYLGRISQGFFAFHALGVWGDVAAERLKHAKETIWLLDSNIQIGVLSLATPTNSAWVDALRALKARGVRLFTSETLFEEAWFHYTFAHKVVKMRGSASSEVLAAATGEPPYLKQNLFLQGFITWQGAGNPCDWQAYAQLALGHPNPAQSHLRSRLAELGIEVIALEDWPGFTQDDYAERDSFIDRIVQLREQHAVPHEGIDASAILGGAYRKAKPEADAYTVVMREREGRYYVMSESGMKSPSWFISNTSLLNILGEGQRITWLPEAFLRFATTLPHSGGTQDAERAFETLLWGLAEVGVQLIDERVIARVCGGAIEQELVDLTHELDKYKAAIEEKYGEPTEAILARLSPTNRVSAAIQLSAEMLDAENKRRRVAESVAEGERNRADKAEGELREVVRFKRKMEAKRLKAKSRKRGQKSRKKKRK